MRVGEHFHLTYCSNIHAGHTWPEVSDALASTLPSVRQGLNLDGPLAIGLRLSAEAAESLEEPANLEAFLGFLRRGNYYVLTINGFPYGAFHGERVKERVYLPDWRDPARLEYTNRLARLMARFLEGHDGIEGSVSTVPGAFRPDIATEHDATQVAEGVLRHAVTLVGLQRQTGKTVTLALEPEPACFLETLDDVIPFFIDRLFNPDLVDRISRETGVAMTVSDVRRHVGICLDACHMAVEFERPGDTIRRLAAAGIRICKVQLSSALRLTSEGGPPNYRALERFADDTYLHQVVQRDGGTLTRHIDLPEALAAARVAPGPDAAEWRVHFHVPIFLAQLNAFGTTQPDLIDLLHLLREGEVCPYLEVETYTWDVLPPEYRNVDVSTAIVRELNWVRTTLAS